MCDPVTIAAAAAITAAIGTGVTAYSTAQQHKYEARIADRNADLASEQAANAQDRTRTEALRHYRRVGQLKGQQQAAMAANGLDTSFGSALDVQRDTSMLAAEDARSIYEGGFEEARGFEISASNYTAQGRASRSAATAAMVKGVFDTASTALGGATQYNSLKAARAGAG